MRVMVGVAREAHQTEEREARLGVPGVDETHPSGAAREAPVLEVVHLLEAHYGVHGLEHEDGERRRAVQRPDADCDRPFGGQAVHDAAAQQAHVPGLHVGVAQAFGLEPPRAAELPRTGMVRRRNCPNVSP